MDLEELHEDDDAQTTAEDLSEEEQAAATLKAEEDADAEELKPGDDGYVEDPRNVDGRSDEDEDIEVTNGIESFLSDFNIEGGMIQIQDEEGNPVEKHFDELSEVEKLNVLKSLSEASAANIEQKYDLQESELDLLNAARNAKVDIKDYVEQLAQKRVDELSALSESTDVDFAAMSDDAVFMKFIKDSDPEATEEDIAEELVNAKNGKLFSKNVDRMRETYIQDQVNEAAEAEAERIKERQADLEVERKSIVEAVVEMDKVADWKISDDDKNQVLEKILEVNDHGDPVFMEEIFSDPKVLFKAAWLYYNAEEKMDHMTSYYKKEIGSAFKRGFDQAQKGLSPTPINGTRPSGGKKSSVKTNKDFNQQEILTLADLDDD